MITVIHDGKYSYVYRKPTRADELRYIGNGYVPPDLVSERDPSVYRYARCELPPNYPMPAIPVEVTNILNGPPIRTYSRNRQQTYWVGSYCISRY